MRLRKALKTCFAEALQIYHQTFAVVKGFSEQLNLEKYYDVYDISDLDISDVMQGITETDTEESESLRSLKIAAARFHTLRKMFLCALLTLEASGDSNDLLTWTTAVEAIRTLNSITSANHERLASILGEQECKSHVMISTTILFYFVEADTTPKPSLFLRRPNSH